MNMLNVDTGAMPPLSNGPFDRLLALKQDFVLWWQDLHLAKKVLIPAFIVAVLASVVVVGSTVYGFVSDTNSLSAAEVPTAQASSQAKPAIIASTAPSSDALGLVDQNIDHLVTGYELSQKSLSEVRAMTSTNTSDIKAVKTDMGVVKEIISKDDPKLMKSLRDSLERIKKIMAVPPVPLTPVSALEEQNKAA